MSIIQSVIKANLDNIKPHLPQSRENDNSFAFLVFSMTSILDITINEAIFCATEGRGDGGIDGIYIDENEDNILIHVFQSKYRTNLEKGLGKNEIDLTIGKVEEIFQGHTVKNQSGIIKNKIDEIREIIMEKGALKMPEVHVHFVVNTFKPNDSEKERAKILESKGNYLAFYYDGNDLLQLIDKSKQKECRLNVTTYKDILYLGADKKLGDVRGIVATLPAPELVKIFDSAGKDKVLSRNIRYFLGNNKINKKIKETASSLTDSKYFWFLNNGVTIVCAKFSFTDDSRGNKIINMTNPRIINGGQTTKTLYNLFNELQSAGKSIEDVYLLLRLYETDNEKLIDKITEGTNSQNPIFERDLKANNPVQLLIKKYFKEKGYFYESHRNEYRENSAAPLEKIANNERIFQAYISLFKNMPHIAKSSKSKIFEKYFDDVFVNADRNLPMELLISHLLLTFIESQAKKYYLDWKNGDVFMRHGELGLVYLFGKIFPAIKTDSDLAADASLLEIIYDLAVKILRKIINIEKQADSDYSHNKFFKSREFTEKVDKSINATIIDSIVGFLTAKQKGTVKNIVKTKKQILTVIESEYKK